MSGDLTDINFHITLYGKKKCLFAFYFRDLVSHRHYKLNGYNVQENLHQDDKPQPNSESGVILAKEILDTIY